MTEKQSPVRLVITGLLIAYGVLFVLLNNDEIKLNFIFFSTTASLVVALILIGALGFAVGFLAHISYLRNRRKDRRS
jgi:uncharacterized integral membrane protein